MSTYIHVNTGIKVPPESEIFFFIDNAADKIRKNLMLGAFFTYKDTDYATEQALYRTAKINKATKTIKAIDDKMRFMYRINGFDLEKAINDNGNITLAETFGYTITNTSKGQNKVPIEVENGITPGQVLVILLAVFGAHTYNIECTQISETGGVDIVTVRSINFANATLEGFVSGAKYRFRAQAVLNDTTVSEFTAFVELRIN